jgi:hypothetical protein
MNISFEKQEILSDKTKRLLIKIPFHELVYFGYFIESFEGWCNYTTVDKKNNLVQIDINPDFINEMEQLLDFLKHWKIQTNS